MLRNNFYINKGKRLEKLIHDEFKDFCRVISDDCNIKKEFSDGSVIGVDHYIEFDKYFITIQDKWENKTPCIRDINHFISATKNIETIVKKKSGRIFLFGIFASKNDFSKNGKDILKSSNNFASDKFYNIYDNSNIENLTSKVREFILERLDERGIKIKEKNTEIYTLRPYQKDSVNNFLGMMDKNITSGIVNYPTGTGKTIIALTMIGEFMKKFNKLSVLWITRRIDIMKSQFGNNKEKMDICINSGFIPDYDKYKLLKWFNDSTNIELLNDNLSYDKPVFLITNIDSIMYNEKFKDILKDKFGLVILDECHSSGAECTFDMLSFFRNEWLNLKFLAGFSATPIRTDMKKFKRTAELFGDGNFIRFISRMSAEEAIDNGFIVPPEFYWIETYIDKEVSFKAFLDNISSEEYFILIHHIDEILNKSVTKKAIFWAKDTNNANEWLNILKSCKNQITKYPN